MNLEHFKVALTALGVDPDFIRRADITCEHTADKRMVVVVSTYAKNQAGQRYMVLDGETNERVVATEQRIVPLADLMAALQESWRIEVDSMGQDHRTFITR